MKISAHGFHSVIRRLRQCGAVPGAPESHSLLMRLYPTFNDVYTTPRGHNTCLTSSRRLPCHAGWKRPGSLKSVVAELLPCLTSVHRWVARTLITLHRWISCFNLFLLLSPFILTSKFWQPHIQRDDMSSPWEEMTSCVDKLWPPPWLWQHRCKRTAVQFLVLTIHLQFTATKNKDGNLFVFLNI